MFYPAILLLAFAVPPDSVGKALYEHGSESGDDVAVLRPGNVETPARLLACVNCHGAQAEGRSEAGVQIPGLRREYDEQSFRRAVADGIGLDGHALHPAMPSYRFTNAQLSSLMNYVKALVGIGFGVPGVDGQTVRVGFVKGTGPASIRRSLESTYEAVNREGGIYGRRIVLVAANSCDELRTDTLAVVAGAELCKAGSGMLEIGPLTSMREGPNTYTLLASLADQLRVSVEYLRRSQLLPILIRGGSPLASEAFREPLRLLQEDSSVTTTSSSEARAILYIGTEAGLPVALEASPGDLPLVALYAMVGPAIARYSGLRRRPIVLVYPGLLPSEMDVSRIERSSDGTTESVTAQALAIAAADLFVEALKRAGRRLTRESLRSGIGAVRDFQTGLVPPLTFAPGRTAGSRGAYIISVDDMLIRPIGDWVSLED